MKPEPHTHTLDEAIHDLDRTHSIPMLQRAWLQKWQCPLQTEAADWPWIAGIADMDA